MPGIGTINLKVAILDTDYYALQALHSYLAWDRRTRVHFTTHELNALYAYLDRIAAAELPDVIVLDADHLGGPQVLRATLERLRARVPRVHLVCLVQVVDLALAEVAASAGAKAFLLKQDVQLRLNWAVVLTLRHDFLISREVVRAARSSSQPRLYHATALPESREYPEMTDRIREAIKLCVIDGMPAHLAADEMGISLHTIRGYIKEGYRILEAYDTLEYPAEMTPQERAFMRFTALADPEN